MGKFQFPLQFLSLFTYLPILTYATENPVENNLITTTHPLS